MGWAVFVSCVFFLPLRSEEGTFRTTSLGEEVLEGDMDVGPNLLIAVATRFGIWLIGVIAAAFLSCKRELFADVLDAGPAFGLSSRQLALGESVGCLLYQSGQGNGNMPGDVHTAVHWYLKWIQGGRKLPTDLELLFRIACFRKMDERVPKFTADEAKDTLAVFDDQRMLLTVCLAFTHPRRIVHRYGGGYKSTCVAENPIRAELGLPPEETILEISNRSICFSEKEKGAFSWVCFFFMRVVPGSRT